ncbi:MAG: right-handed parallel beta-helix repeat-containing protein [Flavobacteriales bacterium]|nr:right-handed parallel beta-helix repeat-containing protein [Flavobacteriales bacterium]
MKIKLNIVLALAGVVLACTTQASTWRVNINPSSTADFQSLQTAVNSAAPGDILLVEANSGFASEVYFDFFNAIIDKPLEIYGSGYFLAANYPTANVTDEALCGSIQFVAGAENSKISGLSIQNLEVNCDFVEVSGNRIEACVVNGANNTLVQRNFIENNSAGSVALTVQLSSDTQIQFNIISNNPLLGTGALLMQIENAANTVVDHCTIVNGESITQGVLFMNSIFHLHSFMDLAGCVFQSNIFTFGTDVVTPFDPSGLPNDASPIYNDPTNFTEVDPAGLFVLTGSPDGQYQVQTTSVAVGNANDGTDIGAFVIGGYHVGGGGSIPIVTFLQVSPDSYWTYLLPATYTAVSTDQTDVHGGEYFIDADPGVGVAISLTLTAGPQVDGFLAADISGLTPGVHVLGLRVVNDDGAWSTTHETTFEIQPDPVLPTVASLAYVISNDAGAANFSAAIPVDATQDSDLEEFTINYDFTGMQPGVYFVSMRVYDAQGGESVTYRSQLLVEEDEGPLPVLAGFEYFLDVDPGYGGGTFLPVSSGDLFDGELQFELVDANPGPHVLYLRNQDEFGAWSVSYAHDIVVVDEMFFVLDQNNDCNIDVADLLLLLADYGCPNAGAPVCDGGDANGDGAVNSSDVLLFLGLFGQSCDSLYGDGTSGGIANPSSGQGSTLGGGN